MQIGFSKVDITPPILTCTNGGYYFEPKETHRGVHDPLYARTIVFKRDDMSAAIISLDLLSIQKSSVLKIKEMITKHCSIPESNIILHATHQHSGPFPYKNKKGIRNDAYWIVAEQQIAGSVYMAQSNMQRFFVGARKNTLDYALNRRILTKDGKVLYLSHHPGLKPNQIVDNDLGIISFRKLDKRPLITLLNYACHPLSVGFVPGLISADFPGEAVKQVENRLFGTAIYTNGACANVHPKKHCEGFKAMKEFGSAMADKVLEVMPFIKVSLGENIQIIREELSVDLIPEKMDDNEDIREYRNGTSYSLEITILLINDIAFVAIPGEYFVEFQLEIKKKSPFPHTYLLTNSNGYVSYIPDRKSYDQEGYEVESTKFQRGSGEMIMAKICDLLGELVKE